MSYSLFQLVGVNPVMYFCPFSMMLTEHHVYFDILVSPHQRYGHIMTRLWLHPHLTAYRLEGEAIAGNPQDQFRSEFLSHPILTGTYVYFVLG